MTVNREDLNPCTVQLHVTCDPEEVRAGFDRAKRQLSKKVRLPGFRPGHAPKALVEQYLDKSALYDEAIEQIVGGAYRQAIKDAGITPETNTRPRISVTKLTEDSCEFTAKVGLPAVVELGDYSAIEVERPRVEVTDEDVDRFIEDMRRRRSTREAVTERGVRDGDVVVLNIKPDETEGDGRNFMLIAGQTFQQLDDALRDMRIEDVKHLQLDFPASFQEKDWAGKATAATISVNSISAVRLPELDDSFAQSMESKSLDELRGRVREGLRRAAENAAESIHGDRLLDELLARSRVEVSDNTWEPIAERKLQEDEERLKKQGKTLEAFAKESGLTLEQLRESHRQRARQEVMRALLIREVSRKEQVEVSPEDLHAELLDMAGEYGMQPEAMLQTLEKAGASQELQFRAIARKVRSLLAGGAQARQPAGAIA